MIRKKWYSDGEYYYNGDWTIRPAGNVWYVSGNGVAYATPFASLKEAMGFAQYQDSAWITDGAGYKKDGWKVRRNISNLAWKITTPQGVELPAQFEKVDEAKAEADKIMKVFHDLDLILNQ